MSWKSRGYILLILLGGASVLTELSLHWKCEDPIRFAIFAALAFATGFWRFRIPGMEGTLSASFLFVMISMVQLSGVETLAVGALGAIGQVFAVTKTRGFDRVLEAAFQLSGSVIAAHASARIYGEFLPSFEFLHFPMRLAITAVAFFVFSSLPLAILTSFKQNRPVVDTWRNCWFWTLPYYVIGAGVAGFLWAVGFYDDLQASLLVVPCVYVLFSYYQLYVTRLETEKQQAQTDRAAAEDNAALHMRTIQVLARAIDAKEQTTRDQLRRIQVYCTEIGKALNLDPQQQLALSAASLLHDIGNLAVPEYITSKPGRLTAEEFEKMKIHAVVGAEILEGVRFPYPVAPIVRHHHERWDGTGYPLGLCGKDIPIGARILGVVDVFDAMTSERIYRPAMPIGQALTHLRNEAGGSFDPHVVEIILDRWQEFEELAREGADSVMDPRTESSAEFVNTIAAAKDEEHFLNTLSARVLGCEDVDSFFANLTGKLQTAIPFDAFVFYRRNGEELHALAAGGVDKQIFAGLKLRVGAGVSGKVVEANFPAFNAEPALELRAGGSMASTTSLRSAIGVPVMGARECIGVLTLFSKSRDCYSKDHVRVLTAVANRLAHLVENFVRVKAAEGAATTDELTQLPNARAVSNEIRAACARAVETSETLSLVVFDLDGFKKLNDTHGHLAGNRALQEVAQGAMRILGRNAFIGRMGGDEFVALFPRRTREQAITEALQLQHMVEETGLRITGTPMLSTSWGIAMHAEDGNLPEALLAAADRRMYEYKRTKEERTAARLARLANTISGTNYHAAVAARP